MLRLSVIALILAGCVDSKPAPTPPRTTRAAPSTWTQAPSLTRADPATIVTAPPAIRAPSTLPPRAARADNTACADCHPDQAESFAKTGMGRSMVKAVPAAKGGPAVIESFEKATVVHAPTGLIYKAILDKEGRYWQEERHPSHASVRRIQATHIIGSGNHTRSYLGLRDGDLVQLPLTWYATRKIWDFSPGYDQANMPRFSRRVEAPCLFCHNGLTPLAEGRAAAYAWPLAEGIGCDRCHGDGAAHVKARLGGMTTAAGAADATIFNPKRHSPERQLQVCQQCHLQADASVVHAGHSWDAYDPRLPLDAYLSVFRKSGQDGAEFSIASQGRRLALSACAKVSAASPDAVQLGCTTCHNPHDTATDATYAQACLGCHQPGAVGSQAAKSALRKGCSDAAGQQPTALCHTCHMRSGGTSDVPHVEFTDHFIRRRPTKVEARPARGLALEDMVAGAAPPDAWLLGMAHTHLWERMRYPEHLTPALKTLDAALQAQPTDVRALTAMARALAAQNQRPQAEAVFEKARQAGAMDEKFMLDRAANAAAGQQWPLAKTAYEATVARYPSGDAWLGLARARQRTGDGPGAVEAFTEAARFDDARAQAQTQLGALALRQRTPDAAREHLEAARAADPLFLPALLWQGTLAMDAGKPADAIALLDQVIAGDPTAHPAYAMRAQANLALSRYDAAFADFEILLKAAPDQPQPWIMYVRGALKAGRKTLARTKLTEALERFPGNPQLMQAARALR